MVTDSAAVVAVDVAPVSPVNTTVNALAVDAIIPAPIAVPSATSPLSSGPLSMEGAMGAARDAFRVGDVDASKAAHEAKRGIISKATEVHGGAGAGFIKSIVFGALDAVVTGARAWLASVLRSSERVRAGPPPCAARSSPRTQSSPLSRPSWAPTCRWRWCL